MSVFTSMLTSLRGLFSIALALSASASAVSMAGSAAADPIVPLQSLLLRPYSDVRAELLSGSWAPRIEELVYLPPDEPRIVPTSSMRQSFLVVDVCFSKRITPMGVYVLLTKPETVDRIGADQFLASYGRLVSKYRPGCDPDVQQLDLGRPPF